MKAGHGNDARIKYTVSNTVTVRQSKGLTTTAGGLKNYIYGNDMCLINLVTVLLPNQVEVIL